MQTNSPVERETLLDALAEYEWRLRLAWNRGDQRFPIDPAPLPQVQDSLKSDETLLEYVLDEPNSFCISVTHKTVSLRVLPAGRSKSKNWFRGTLMKSARKKLELRRQSNWMRCLCNRFLKHPRANDSSLCRTAY